MKSLLTKLGIHSRADFAAFCGQFLKFGAVGLSNTAITLLAQYALMYVHVHYNPAYAIAFLLGVANSFYWNSRYVFRVPGSRGLRGFVRLLFANGVTLLAGLGTLALLVEALGVPQGLAPVLNMAVTVPLNFLLVKFWAFK
jgi:putative flippase GtrA